MHSTSCVCISRVCACAYCYRIALRDSHVHGAQTMFFLTQAAQNELSCDYVCKKKMKSLKKAMLRLNCHRFESLIIGRVQCNEYCVAYVGRSCAQRSSTDVRDGAGFVMVRWNIISIAKFNAKAKSK